MRRVPQCELGQQVRPAGPIVWWSARRVLRQGESSAPLQQPGSAHRGYQLDNENQQLLRDYIRNFAETKRLVPYVVGRYTILDSFDLGGRDLFPSGVVAVTSQRNPVTGAISLTPMTEVNEFPMPFVLSADKAARKILYAIARKKKVYDFPWATNLMMRSLRWMPDWLVARIFRGITGDRPQPAG